MGIIVAIQALFGENPALVAAFWNGTISTFASIAPSEWTSRMMLASEQMKATDPGKARSTQLKALAVSTGFWSLLFPVAKSLDYFTSGLLSKIPFLSLGLLGFGTKWQMQQRLAALNRIDASEEPAVPVECSTFIAAGAFP